MKKGSSGNKKKQRRKPVPHPQRHPKRKIPQEVHSRQKRQASPPQGYPSGEAMQVSESRKRTASKRAASQKRRENRLASRALPLFVFVVIAVYLVGQVASMAWKNTEVNVETVTMGSIDAPEGHKGLIVRDEVVVKANRTGTPFYEYAEGDSVKKSAVVCHIKDTDSTDKLEDKLENIDANILETQKDRTDLSVFAEDIDRLEQNMYGTVEAFAGKSMSNNTSYLYAMRGQLDGYIRQRNEIWLSENVDSLSQLNEERSAYQKQLSQNMSDVEAVESGILALSYDGLEEKLTKEKLKEISARQIGGNENMTVISKEKDVAKGDPLFRIVKSNQWYLVAVLPEQATKDWEEGQRKRIHLVAEEEVLPATVTIESIEKGEKENKVILSCFHYMESFMNKRLLTFRLDSQAVQGLKVPANALVEKFMIKIPVDCIIESRGNKGVLLVNGSNGKFVPVTLIDSDEKYVYLPDENSEGATLKVGDIIMEGTGETAKPYTVSEKRSATGVYVANSSLAKFVAVKILEQNQEYAIVKSNNNYGLQAYDSIVSDAKNIKEGQEIY